MSAYATWEVYLEAVYAIFREHFVDDKPTFEGRRFGLKRHPTAHGKEATFWHLIQEGREEADRVPDVRRCERIGWPRAIIDNRGDAAVKVWSNVRQGDSRICLWLDSGDYLVVLADRSEYVLLWTAYMTDRAHTRRKLLREWQRSQSGA